MRSSEISQFIFVKFHKILYKNSTLGHSALGCLVYADIYFGGACLLFLCPHARMGFFPIYVFTSLFKGTTNSLKVAKEKHLIEVFHQYLDFYQVFKGSAALR
jgi:hypothetical protein